MESCIYEGWVRHRRYTPVTNAFRYRLFMLYLDLAELPRLFEKRWFWSARRFALGQFRRKDYVGHPSVPLDTTIRDLVHTHCGKRPTGPIRLLTNLRYFGHCFNPVSFYYCFDDAGVDVRFVIAEVSNTPWGERHCYIMEPAADLGKEHVRRYRFDKDFHVSPFMPMDVQYDWRFRVPDGRLIVHNDSTAKQEKFFDSTLSLRRREITGAALNLMLLRFPFQTLRVVALIHWQALKLLIKRVPYIPHPRKSSKLTIERS